MSLYPRILVAIDGSAASQRALEQAISLAQALGSRLHLVHIVDELSYVTGFESAMNYLNEIIPLMREAGQKVLASARQHALDKGVGADVALVVEGPGRVCDQIIAHAVKSRADLVVVGSHGRRGVNRLLMGSDAEQVVRLAPVPVLVVRGAAEVPADGL